MSEITISVVLGGFFALAYLSFTGLLLGRALLPAVPNPWRTILGAGLSLALLSIIGTGVYYLFDVTLGWLVVECIVVGGVALVLAKPTGCRLQVDRLWSSLKNFSFLNLLPATCNLLVGIIPLSAWWYAVLTHPVVESVRGPWAVLSPFALVALLIAAIMSIVLMASTDERTSMRLAGQILFMLTIFSGLALIPLMYPLGYGFDPFLHRATVEHIAEYGTITPKPLYYIGQYAIELIGTKLCQLPLFALDVWLAPLLAALLIPAALFATVDETKNKSLVWSTIPLALLPLAAFVSTTPQALSFIFASVVIFLTAPRLIQNVQIVQKDLLAPFIFALAALAAHPLSGAIVSLYLAMVFLRDRRRVLFWGIFVLMCFALPLAFTLQAWKAGLPLGFSLPSLVDLTSLPLTLYFGTNFNAWGDVAYFIIGNSFIAVMVGAIIIYRRVTNRSLASSLPLLAGLAAFINFILLALFFDFPYLITYERTDFALRALTLTTLFVLPYWSIHRTDCSTNRLQVAGCRLRKETFYFAIAVIFITNIYAAYPRHDNYARSAAFNVSAGDFEAVQLIDEIAQGQDYAVLSNQATSSAAMATYGFKKYYHGDIFFYPIPTGGELYKIFLEMNTEPSLEVIDEARQLTGASTIFYAVSDYWWKASWIIENTKPLADQVVELGQGATTVFVFQTR